MAAHDNQLQAALKSRHVSMIAIGGIIGAGLFVGSSSSIAQVGPAVVMSYGLAGLVVLMVMRMMAEMAALRPGLGAFTELVREVLGPRAGFVCGWLYWYFWVIVVPIEAIAGAKILHIWIDAPVWAIGVALLGMLTGVNLMSTRSYGEFEYWFSLMKVLAIVSFIAIAGVWAFGLTSPTGPTWSNLNAYGGFAPHGWGAVLAGTASVIFALTGAEIATVAAAESHEPARTIARITSSVAARIILFYVLSLLLIVAVMPWTSIVPGTSPFAIALGHMAIPHAEFVMNLVVLVAVLSCLNSGMYVTSRVLFVLADKGDAPAWLVAVNRRKVPARAILIASLFGYLALAASVISPELVFSFLVNASGALMLFIYFTVGVAQIVQRRRIETEGRETLPIRMWLFPYLSYATLGAILSILVAMMFAPARRVELISSLVTLGVAAGAAWWRRRA